MKRLVGFEMQFGPFAVAQLRLFAEVVDLTTPASDESSMKTKPLADPDEETAWIRSSLASLALGRERRQTQGGDHVVIGNPP